MASILKKADKIYVAGHRGLLGSHIVLALQKAGFTQLVLRTHQELDLEDALAVQKFFAAEKPQVVFLAAAKVGGILANNQFRADFIAKNLQIQNHVILAAHQHDVRRLIFLGSSCIYPKAAPQPMRELALLTGELEPTNRPYAIAKIAGLELIAALRSQHQRDYFSVMPTNLYGPHDNFDPLASHVVPAMIQRFCQAKSQGKSEVTIWGTGKPLRELMFAADCAEAIVFLAQNLSSDGLANSPVGKAGWSHVNVGSGQEVSISDLAKLIQRIIGLEAKLLFDSTKPDGTPRKLLDCTMLNNLGWKAHTSLEDGLRQTIAWYLKNAK